MGDGECTAGGGECGVVVFRALVEGGEVGVVVAEEDGCVGGGATVGEEECASERTARGVRGGGGKPGVGEGCGFVSCAGGGVGNGTVVLKRKKSAWKGRREHIYEHQNKYSRGWDGYIPNTTTKDPMSSPPQRHHYYSPGSASHATYSTGPHLPWNFLCAVATPASVDHH